MLRFPRPAAALSAAALLAVSVLPAAFITPASAAVRADAAAATTYKVTYVALDCDEYTDIMANRARNNIQESLKDLGQDTTYTAGDPVRPSVENAVPTQAANCVPLSDWRLTLGAGYTGKTASSLYLSTVTSPFSTSIVTQDSTPELDARGNPTGRTLEGAVTVDLTPQQANLAQRASSLWVQGGTPSAPLNGKQEEFGFGALRCGIDNLNGDNVEWIGFSNQATHTFCYYFAVSPPPDGAVIRVVKRLAEGTSGPATFRFVGNISYTENKDFTLTPRSDTQPATATFVRGADTVWNFEEQPSDGFVPVGPPTCTDTGGEGSSDITIDGQRVDVQPAPGATVTCTYTNEADITGPLRLSKVTRGGVGTFDFDVDFPTGTIVNYPVTTTDEGVPEIAADVPSGPTGDYSVTENLPADSARGSWELTSASCNGNEVALTGTTFGGSVGIGESVDCVVENTFTPGGSLEIRKTTIGGVGTFGYQVLQVDNEAEELTGETATLRATTTAEDTATTAVVDPEETSLDLDALPVGEATSTFAITELLPPATEEGFWQVAGIECNVPGIQPRVAGNTLVIITIPESQPDAVCDFTNVFVPSASLTLTKVIDDVDGGRIDDVVIELTCDDGTDETLRVPLGEDVKSLPELLFFLDQRPLVSEEIACTIEETETGVGPDATVDTGIAAVVDGEIVEVVEGTAVDLVLSPGDVVEVVVADIYTVTGGGTDGGGGGGGGNDGGGSGGPLPETGAGDAATLAQWALLALLVGAWITAVARRA